MSLDLNVYPDQYPIFNKTRQFLVRNHIASIGDKSRNIKISTSIGFRRDCEIQHDPRISPSEIANLNKLPDSDKINNHSRNYNISYYPTSPLNPELEEQCMFLELFRNIDKLDFRREKVKNPTKIIRKAKKFNFSADISRFHNFSAFSRRETSCPECGLQKCNCNLMSQLLEKPAQPIYHAYSASTKKETQIVYKIKNKNNSLDKPTRKRKKINLKLDYEGLRKNLLITPLLT